MKKLLFSFGIVIAVIVVILTIGFIALEKPVPVEGLTSVEAVEKIKNVPEVRQYIDDLAKAGSRAKFNAEDGGEDWNIQVFEIVNQGGFSHTATFQWYKVNKKTGEVLVEFE